MTSPSDPIYIRRGGEQTFAPPFLQKDTKLRGYAIRVKDASALQRTLDKYLNEPVGRTRYRALGDVVLVGDAPIGSTQSLTPPDSSMGYTPETDIAFWMPIVVGDDVHGEWKPKSLAWFLPYVWVDVPTTVTTGREVYGYPKELGWMSEAPGGFSLEAMVLPTYSAETKLVRRPVLTIEKTGEGPGHLEQAWEDLESALGDLFRMLYPRGHAPISGLELAIDAAEMALKAEVPMVFLKEFRDVVRPERACYQAVLESPAKVEKFRGAKVLWGDYRLTVQDWASHPIAAELGLVPAGTSPSPGTATEVPVQMAFEIDFDFRVELGRNIHEASTAPAPKRKKIAVLGGGLGSLTTAYWLTEKPNWRDEYDITVYQMGWRLGGKGASGRAGAKYGRRIEEHGLHIWFGFYENAFRTLGRALDQLQKMDPPPVRTFASWKEAFTPQSLVTMEQKHEGRWRQWPVLFPPNDAVPGTGGVIDLWAAFQTLVGWIKERLVEHERATGRPVTKAGTAHEGIVSRVLHAFADWVGAEEDSVLDRIERVTKSLPTDDVRGHDHEHHTILSELIRLLRAGVWDLVENHLSDFETSQFWILFDLGTTTAIGILEDRLFKRGFESADDLDWIDWLRKFGAKPVSLDSGPVWAVYDLVFGFERGDTNRPNFAAGTATRGILRMVFTYKGRIMWKMEAGMGDTIFTPLYGLLAARGVRFEFFHKVEELRLDAAGRMVDEIQIARQVRLADEKAGYRPLENVKGLDCWPADPRFDQIVDGEKLKSDPFDPGRPYDLESYWTSWPSVETRVLRRGVDFDLVVQGLSVGALPHVCKELLAASPRWATMADGVKTTQTQGVQLWLTPTTSQMGFVIPPWAIEYEKKTGKKLGLDPVLGAYEQDLDTWADMTHLLPREDWPAAYAPKSVAYLCGPLKDFAGEHPFTDHRFPAEARAAVQTASVDWLRRYSAPLWPKATTPGTPALDPALLVDPDGRTGDARYDAQFYRANIDPTERYVLTVAGSTALRIRPDDSGFEGLYLAGDWTHNGVLNAGCVEATVVSGMECARAICGYPEEIVGDTDTVAAGRHRR